VAISRLKTAIRASSVAIATAAASFVILAIGVTLLIFVWMIDGHEGDPGAGDAIFGLLIFGPGLLFFYLLAAVAIGFIAFGVTYFRLRSAKRTEPISN
jgi:hypothetical protein